ncbi:MAG: methyltransferase domain-containing protein [Gemmatimonadaceae bacterium]|nr:methyltransferase domain-containing protein [Gemmatimonadaceae bacterium]
MPDTRGVAAMRRIDLRALVPERYLLVMNARAEARLGIRSPTDVHADCQRLLRAGIGKGDDVLDVGCGNGELMIALAAVGARVRGVEIDPTLVDAGRRHGLEVDLGSAEALPMPDASVDVVMCSVVVPYTDQRRAVAEWARVLRPGGRVHVTYHGVGYGLHYLLAPPEGWRSCVYGARMLLNTVLYELSGTRLPGWIGDTLCQRDSEMRRAYSRSGFAVTDCVVPDRTLGVPRILFHALRRGGGTAAG